MTARFYAALALACAAFIPQAAAARGHHHYGVTRARMARAGHLYRHRPDLHIRALHRHGRNRHASHARAPAGRSVGDPRPRQWCGWWMRHYLHVADRNGNRAIWWAGYGTRASGPGKRILGVKAHHVYLVLAVVGPGRVLAISGNDSGRCAFACARHAVLSPGGGSMGRRMPSCHDVLDRCLHALRLLHTGGCKPLVWMDVENVNGS